METSNAVNPVAVAPLPSPKTDDEEATSRRDSTKLLLDPSEAAPNPHRKKQRNCGPQMRYIVDRLLGSSYGQTVVLTVTGLIMTLLGALIYLLQSIIYCHGPGATEAGTLDSCSVGWGDSVWISWTYFSAPGQSQPENTPALRLISFIITILGVVFFAAITGFIVDGIRFRLDKLREGRIRVIERGHHLLVGWSDTGLSMLHQLMLAMESEGGGVVVILTEEDRSRVEEEIHLAIRNRRKTRIVVRKGSGIHISDLLQVGVTEAKCVTILAPGGDADKADAFVLQVVLALSGLKDSMHGHVVAEMRDIDNRVLVESVGYPIVETVVSHDIVGRLMIKSAQNQGLAVVYDSLFGFDRDEFYLKAWPELVGLTFKDILTRFSNAIPIGVKRSIEFPAADGTMKTVSDVIINPKDAFVFGETDELLVIAEDDGSYQPLKEPLAPALQHISAGTESDDDFEVPVEEPRVQKLLMCGWRRDMDDIILLYDKMVAKGSELHVLCEVPIYERSHILSDGGLELKNLKNITLLHHLGNSVVRRHLKSVGVHKFDAVLILADEALENDTMHSDSHSVASLLTIREMQRQHRESKANSLRFSAMPSLVDRGSDRLSLPEMAEGDAKKTAIAICEILDGKTRVVINSNKDVAGVSDYVLSNEIVAKCLATVAENRVLMKVLSAILGPEDIDVNVVPYSKYGRRSDIFTFNQISHRVRQSNQDILLGYFLMTDAMAESTGGVTQYGEPVINPKNRNEKLTLGGRNGITKFIVLTGSLERRPSDGRASIKFKRDGEIAAPKARTNDREAPFVEEFRGTMREMSINIAKLSSTVTSLSSTVNELLARGGKAST